MLCTVQASQFVRLCCRGRESSHSGRRCWRAAGSESAMSAGHGVDLDDSLSGVIVRFICGRELVLGGWSETMLDPIVCGVVGKVGCLCMGGCGGNCGGVCTAVHVNYCWCGAVGGRWFDEHRRVWVSTLRYLLREQGLLSKPSVQWG